MLIYIVCCMSCKKNVKARDKQPKLMESGRLADTLYTLKLFKAIRFLAT